MFIFPLHDSKQVICSCTKIILGSHNFVTHPVVQQYLFFNVYRLSLSHSPSLSLFLSSKVSFHCQVSISFITLSRHLSLDLPRGLLPSGLRSYTASISISLGAIWTTNRNRWDLMNSRYCSCSSFGLHFRARDTYTVSPLKGDSLRVPYMHS